jgi:leucyl aminopeptidase
VGLPTETLDNLVAALGVDRETLIKETVVAAHLGLYRCNGYRGKDAEKEPADPRRLIFFFTENKTPDAAHRAARQGEAEAAGILFARDLSNGPANHITPDALARTAGDLARAGRYACTIFGPQEIREKGMGAFWAVAQGAREEPRFIILEHCPPGKDNDDPLVFIGKGITFDTGGTCLKPAAKMHEMKGDMGGAAAVLGFFKALDSLPEADDLPRIIGIIPATENMPGGAAARPGDVVTTLSGKTVEILNTDAEGRLILCDAITYAQTRWTPRVVADIATLTGACVIALGDQGAGVFSKDKELRRTVLDAAEATGELFWPLPLWDAYDANLKSDVADFANIGPREGGSLHAALFLQRFVEKGTRWIHLDIAGPGYVLKTTSLHPVPGGTGVGVRILCELARAFCSAQP